MRSRHPDDRFERVNAPLLRHFSELVTDLGGCLPAVLEAANIPAELMADCRRPLTYRQAILLIEAAAETLNCVDFGMRLATRQQGGSAFGPLGIAMRNSPTFGDALKYACDHSEAHSRAARIWLWPSSSKVFAGHELLLENVPARAQAIEQILLLGHLEAMAMTGGYARARKVHFRHEPISPCEVYRRNFGCEVKFGEHTDGLTFSEFDLASPIASPSSQVHEAVAAYIDANFPRQRLPFHTEVRALILRRLALGLSSSSEVAAAMNLHPRTLRRRLAEEGASFQQVKDEVRRDLVCYYLAQTALDIRSISEKIGFAEQANFSRCCQRWFGMPPSALRRSFTAAD